MKIVVIGTRGFPNILGGVETHSEELYPRIAARGHDVTVIRRKPYVTPDNRIKEFKGVKLIDIYAPKSKSAETLTHTFLAIIKARRLKPDILHIHAIGPSFLTPFARLLGLKVVVTNHGPDYNRQKWGKIAKFVLRTGEKFGTRFANRVIVISDVISEILASKYGRKDTSLIFNGVTKPDKSTKTDWLEKWGIAGEKYIVTTGRFVKEKGFHDLIEAYRRSGLDKKFKLVIAGDADHPDEYSKSLKKKARENGVILTGFIKGEAFNQLLTNASLFVLPSYHEGLPIALLEAMSYDLDILASDIPANRLSELSENDFFSTGDVDSLANALCRKLKSQQKRCYDLSLYNWDNIAERTIDVYSSLL